MKRTLLFVFAMVLAFSMAGTAAAATSKTSKAQAIKVMVDGKTIDIGAKLVIKKGKAFAEAGELFKQLGYETEYDPSIQTLYAEAKGVVVQASVGGDVAFVSGRVVASKGELIEQNGSMLVGLRFVGALTDHKVEWSSQTQTITFTYQGPTEEQKAAVFEVFSQMLIIESTGDTEALAELMSEDTVIDITGVQEQWKKTKTKTNIEEISLQSYSESEAVAVLIEDTSKVSGDFFVENKSQNRYTLHKNKEGKWKIYNVEMLGQQVTNIPGLFEQKVSIPEPEKAAIGKVFQEQLTAAKEKNIDAYVGTLVDFPGKEDLKVTLKDLFQSASITITMGDWEIVEYNGSDKAKLLVTMFNEVETDGVVTKSKGIVLNDAEKVDGKWLLSPETTLLSNEQL